MQINKNTRAAIHHLWRCTACNTLNKDTATKCSVCKKPRLNGNWPKCTWFQRQLKVVRTRELEND